MKTLITQQEYSFSGHFLIIHHARHGGDIQKISFQFRGLLITRVKGVGNRVQVYEGVKLDKDLHEDSK